MFATTTHIARVASKQLDGSGTSPSIKFAISGLATRTSTANSPNDDPGPAIRSEESPLLKARLRP
jgi:hypothetical protein